MRVFKNETQCNFSSTKSGRFHYVAFTVFKFRIHNLKYLRINEEINVLKVYTPDNTQKQITTSL